MAPIFQSTWEEYEADGDVYFVALTDWANSTHYNSKDINSFYGKFGNNYVPYFAVIGADNKLYHSNNSVNFKNALDNAIASFENTDLFVENPIENYNLQISTSTEFDLNSIFSSASSAEMNFEIIENSSPENVSVAISEDKMTVTSNSTYRGSIITVKATTAADSAFHRFTVNVDNYTLDEIIAESFEDVQFPPEGWSITKVAGDNGEWKRNLGGRIPGCNDPADGDYIAYFNSYSGSCDPGNWTRLELPSMDLREQQDVIFRFFFDHSSNYVNYGNDTLQVQVKQGDEEWLDLEEPILRYAGEEGFIWKEYFIDLSAFEGKNNIQLGLLAKSANGSDLMIDKIKVMGKPTNGIENQQSALVPETVILHGNYPNPFNPTTTISYQLLKAQQVSLAVFNSLGAKVWETEMQTKEAGNHNLNFNGAGLESGVYFYKLQAETKSLTGKMMLLK